MDSFDEIADISFQLQVTHHQSYHPELKPFQLTMIYPPTVTTKKIQHTLVLEVAECLNHQIDLFLAD